MKPRIFLPSALFTSVVALSAQAQVSPPNGPPPSAPASSATMTMIDGNSTPAAPDNAALRTSEQLEKLLGPIALYPDPLIALILPASTNASDIVLASRFLNSGTDSSQLDAQPWDESVKSLSRYPEVVKWMDENLEWTKQLGEAFVSQPSDVMNAVQRLRTQARAAGSLVDTPQQQVVTQDNAISIYPTEPDVIYVPSYDPDIVYVGGSRYGYGYPFLTFGVSYAIGPWLDFDCDWGHRRIWVDRSYHSGSGRDWRRPSSFPRGPVFNNDLNRHVWAPAPNRPHSFPNNYSGPRHEVVRPNPFNGGPGRPGIANTGPHHEYPANRPRLDVPAYNPSRSVSDGRNHAPTRNRDNGPHVDNPASPPNGSSTFAPGLNNPGAQGNRGRNPAVASPGSAAPTVNSREGADRFNLNRGDDRSGVHSNFRAGSMERPHNAPAPAPGISSERPQTFHHSAAPERSAPAPSIHSAPAASSVNDPSGNQSQQQSGPRGGGSMSSHER